MLNDRLNNTHGAKPLRRLLAAAMLCLLLGGCGTWSGDSVVKVIGEVTLDGKLLTDAKVVFVPMRFRDDDGLIIPLAFGKTDAMGVFELKSGDQKGVLPGRYRVLILQSDALEDGLSLEDTIPNEASQSDVAATELANLLNEPKMSLTTDETIPAKYNLHSELECVVDLSSGIDHPKFHLTSE